MSNLDTKPRQYGSLSTEEYIEKLQKDNKVLVKVLTEKNKIIELSGNELRKLRINFQKLQTQNLQLAQANSQILAELNSGKDRLKTLVHELGCKNGLLKARELKLEGKGNGKAAQVSEIEVENFKFDVESIEEDQESKRPSNTNKRRQSKTKTVDLSTEKPEQSKEKVDKKRFSGRRQSSRFAAQEPEQTGALLEVDDSDEKNDKKRQRQSARLKCEEPGSTEDESEMDAKTKANVKRLSGRRQQSARFQSRKVEATEDLFDIDDLKLPVSSLCNPIVIESSPTLSGSSVEKDDNSRILSQENGRTSIGRPLRRVVCKVQSYKEVPLNVKMRRSQ